MTDIAIDELTKILLEEHKKNNDDKSDSEKYILSKEDLIRFCIKLEKIIMRCEE